MRGLFLVLIFVAGSAGPALGQASCEPFDTSHTNPPILLKKGNSLVWFQCDPATKEWRQLEPAYYVFKDGKCDSANAVLHDDFFGKATDKEKPPTLKDLDEVWHPKLAGADYKLKIHFRRKKATKYKLCRIGGPCCVLQADSGRQWEIPYEFETFDEDKVTYGLIFNHAGAAPLQFRTCRHAGCAHVPDEAEEPAAP